MQDLCFLFCSSPLSHKRVDEDYAEEYQTAKSGHACALFSYEDLEIGKLSLFGDPISGLTIYRGWMMPVDLYASFFEKLQSKGITLINTPAQYAKYHLLPGWYNDFQDVTAKSVWGDKNAALELAEGLTGPYIVKDYVKSRKHEWYDACFIRDIADKEEAKRVIRNFIDRQEPDLVGGVVLRQFEKLKKIGFHERSGMPISEEYRVFVLGGRPLITDDYWRYTNKPVPFTPEELRWIEMCAERIKSNFVSMDIAQREGGGLVIIELGDGQVSGLQQIKPIDFYAAFDVGQI